MDRAGGVNRHSLSLPSPNRSVGGCCALPGTSTCHALRHLAGRVQAVLGNLPNFGQASKNRLRGPSPPPGDPTCSSSCAAWRGRIDRRDIAGSCRSRSRGRFSTPTLALVGHCDRLTPIACSQETAAAVRGARLKIVPTAAICRRWSNRSSATKRLANGSAINLLRGPGRADRALRRS